MREKYKFALVWFIQFLLGIIETFLALRFVLKLAGASTNSAFVRWIYEVSGTLLDPFRGIFPTTEFESRFVLEFSTLFAILIYAFLFYIISDIIEFFEGLSERRTTS